MSYRFKRSDFVLPLSTCSVLLSSSVQPSFVRNSTKFERAAYAPSRMSVVTERRDPKDTPNVFNYNEYVVLATSSGTFLSEPLVTPTTFIPHHLATPSTWFNSLSSVSTG